MYVLCGQQLAIFMHSIDLYISIDHNVLEYFFRQGCCIWKGKTELSYTSHWYYSQSNCTSQPTPTQLYLGRAVNFPQLFLVLPPPPPHPWTKTHQTLSQGGGGKGVLFKRAEISKRLSNSHFSLSLSVFIVSSLSLSLFQRVKFTHFFSSSPLMEYGFWWASRITNF